MNATSTLLIPSDRNVFRPTFPTRSPAHVGLGFPHRGRNRAAPPAARISGIVIFDRGRSVSRFGRMERPTRPEMPACAPVGSDPLSTVKGDPDWNENVVASDHPPSSLPARPDVSA